MSKNYVCNIGSIPSYGIYLIEYPQENHVGPCYHIKIYKSIMNNDTEYNFQLSKESIHSFWTKALELKQNGHKVLLQIEFSNICDACISTWRKYI